jgi:pilus assembly protein CpaD
VIEVTGYDPGSAGPAPVVVGFERYQAAVPKCNRDWTSVTNTAENGVDPNFGCAVSANMAAMIANPEDIDHPATMTDIDAARREAVLSKYRAGATTSTAKDDQANGAVSTAVQ